MEPWISSETHQRREDLYSFASRSRIIRKVESGQSHSIRGFIADRAQAMSDLLAHVAHAMRDEQA